MTDVETSNHSLHPVVRLLAFPCMFALGIVVVSVTLLVIAPVVLVHWIRDWKAEKQELAANLERRALERVQRQERIVAAGHIHT